MATFLDVNDSLAKVIGGTVDPANPRFFSGTKAADGTGLQAPAGDPVFQGCWSLSPDAIGGTPVGVLEWAAFTARPGLTGQSLEENTDVYRLWIIADRADLVAAMRVLAPYRDLVPAAFRAAMTAGRGTTGDNTQIAATFVTAADAKPLEVGTILYAAIEFRVEVLRTLIPGYHV